MTPLGKLLSSVSSVNSTLPYNWNWQRAWDEVADFLVQHPISLMDIGARGEPPPELDTIRRFVHRVGFEPDPEECVRLNRHEEGSFFPALLASSVGHGTLQLYREVGYSSVLNLTDRYQRLWTGHLPIDQRLDLPTTTLDGFLEEHPALAPDLVKLDTQGSELDILRGAAQSLPRIGLVEVEVEFMQMYEDQPLFGDVADFMSGHGFELLYLNRVLATRRNIYSGPSRGQLLFGDALFGKREDELADFTVEQRAKYVILLCQYGHLDIAWQLLQQEPEIEALIPGLRVVFGEHRHPATRAVLMQLDKLFAIGLHLRRHNQRGTDADRCWPIR